VTDGEAIRLLARWVRELRRDNRRLRGDLTLLRLELDQRQPAPPRWFTAYHAWWIDRYSGPELVDLARELDR